MAANEDNLLWKLASGSVAVVPWGHNYPRKREETRMDAPWKVDVPCVYDLDVYIFGSIKGFEGFMIINFWPLLHTLFKTSHFVICNFAAIN